MTEGQLGRLLPACLHEAIADVLPERLAFYEEWLHADGLRSGRIGLAPVLAVIGFLRTEGAVYDSVVSRAGVLAAEWSLAEVSPGRRRLGAALPGPLRSRFALRLASRFIRDVLSTSSAAAKVRRGRATVRVSASVFCGARDPQPMPLCGFYRALLVETLRAFDLGADARIDGCRAMSAPSCVISLKLSSPRQRTAPAEAA